MFVIAFSYFLTDTLNCDEVTKVHSGDHIAMIYEKTWAWWKSNTVDKLLSRREDDRYRWLAPLHSKAEFILDYNLQRSFHTISLVNTHNIHARDMGTKEFMVYIR